MNKKASDQEDRQDLLEMAKKRSSRDTIESYGRYAEQRRSYEERLGRRRRVAGASRKYRA